MVLAIGVFDRTADLPAALLLTPLGLLVEEGQARHSLVRPDLSAGTLGEEAADNAAIFCNAWRRRLCKGLLESV